jgi:hypothetical protein
MKPEIEAPDMFGSATDFNGCPLRVGATVYRARLGADSERGVVVSIAPPRAHVSWDTDKLGTYPMIKTLCQMKGGNDDQGS